MNASVESGPLHYGLHVLVVTTSLLMWMPVVGPFPEFRIGPAGTTIYLFLQSVVPTVPAGWLVFAEGVVYKLYGEQPVRVWGISPTDDQQIAGAIMKVGGGMFLWTIVVYVFFKKVRVLVRRVARLPARVADADRRDHRPRRGTAHHGRRRAGVRPRAGHTGTGLTRPRPRPVASPRL